MKPIAICKNMRLNPHPFFWNDSFIEECQHMGIPYVVLDPYKIDFLEKVKDCSAVIWHYSMGVHADALEASNILSIIEHMGIPTFPNYNSRWCNDDKIVESFLLREIGAPIPGFYVFFEEEPCLEWAKQISYPIVAKLKGGAGSENVRLIKNAADANRYIHTMFNSGYKADSKVTYKVYSKLQSTHDFETLKKRLKQVPSYLRRVRAANWIPRESGYCYFQEFIPNDGFDLKIVVVGDKLSFIARKIRRGDFRASGGGDCFYDKSLVTKQIISSAFETSDKLKCQCMGYDYVVNKKTRNGSIIEMCFGFDWQTLEAAGGYWDRNFVWHDIPLRVPREILSTLISQISN